MGYEVDKKGISYNFDGGIVDTHKMIKKSISESAYKSEEHLKTLCKKIFDEYSKSTTILSCNLAAYAALELVKKHIQANNIDKLTSNLKRLG